MYKIKTYLFFRTAILLTCLSFLSVLRLSAQFTITENFKGSSVGSNIILGGRNPNPAYLTSGNADPINEGWLRLTEAQGNRAGYAYIDTPFPSTMGVYIEFEYKSWRNRADNTYNGADGFSVFLFDAQAAPFRIGGFGGSLGYANHSDGDQPGLRGAYLGIGIDEYGNFATTSDGRTGGVSGLRPNSITLRGPESTNWDYLTHEQLQTSSSDNGPNSVDYNTVTSTRPNDATFYRKVTVMIEPTGTVTNPRYQITVSWTTTPNENDRQLLTYETTHPIPSSLKLGFGASTGGGFNYHEIRNVLITTPGGVRVQKEVDKLNAVTGDDLRYTINVTNDTPADLENLLLSDEIRDGNGNIIPLSDFTISSITFNNRGEAGNRADGFVSGTPVTSGFSNPFSVNMAMAAKSTASFTIVGKINKMPAGGIIANNVAIDPSATGITDTDPTNNYARVSTTVLNPVTDLKIQKSVNNNGIARLSGNRYMITVSNVSSTNKPSGQVTVRDTIPAGLTVANYTGKTGGLAADGWSVSVNENIYTFTRSDALASMYAYPSIILDVVPEGTGPWVNRAVVEYAYDTNPANNHSSTVLQWINYWYGGMPGKENEWSEPGNWTANFVPGPGEDIEFATEVNNPTQPGNAHSGPAREDLHLDRDRVIGDLINASDKDLWVTTGNELVINGMVLDNNPEAGTIVVKADPDNRKPEGTLLFTNPLFNRNVNATVEFYNQAYDCEDCGFYTRSWQYFGIPVKEADFPGSDVDGNETVNQWVEPFNGNKWQPAPYAPDTELKAFKGYQITNDVETQPDEVYSFAGTFYVGDASVGITRTSNVNYPGANLAGNSYTAAIPINGDALTFPVGVEETVYLFNTGTRDQWRKLNGTAINQEGYRGGQYLAVPVNLGGQNNFPDRIPSMHAFMLLATAGNGNVSNLEIDYSELVKNTTVDRGDGIQIVTRSTNNEGATTAKSTIPSLVMDVIGEQSADRVWIFAKEGTTYGFDNGWDGRKIAENGITQLYVADEADKDRFQVATVPGLNNLLLGFEADTDGKYTVEFALSDHWTTEDIWLHDLSTGMQERVTNGGSYTFEAKEGDSGSRFRLSYSGSGIPMDDEESKITVHPTTDGKIAISNNSSSSCTVFVSDTGGKLLQRLEVQSGGEQVVENITGGIYIVRLQNAVINDVRKVIVK